MGFKVVVIGVSAGGLEAVCTLLRRLPSEVPFALIVVQHRSRDSDALCDVLQKCASLPVSEAVDKDPIEAGRVYLAPPDYHLLIDDGHVALSTDAPEFYSRPSIDLAFESVADAFRDRAVGVVLTGANRDGARGLRRIADRGGHPMVQDPDSAEVSVMPLAALGEVPEAEVVTLDALPQRLCDLAPAPTAERSPR